MTDLQSIFQAFDKLRVLIVGDVMLDSYIWGSIDRISPEAPIPVVSVRKKDFRPGGASNVALNVQSLGATPLVCALIGDDEAGRKLISCLQAKSIDTGALVVSPARPTTEKTRVIAASQHVVRVDEESTDPANPEEEDKLLANIERLLPQCDVVIFEDYDKGVLTPRVIEKTIDLALAAGKPTVVDPKKRNFLCYERVTLFKPNLKELREGLKMDVDGKSDIQIRKAVEKAKARLNVAGIMATLSEHGIYIDFHQQQLRLPAHARDIVDVSGAGDTVVAVAALCVALRLEPRMIASLSNLAGGLVCQKVGVVPVDKQELLKEARAHLS